MATADILSVAARSIGIPALKPEQEKVIRDFLDGRDVFVCQPTGYGKSACYGCLPIVFDRVRRVPDGSSVIIVISPLKALMEDQVNSFTKKGISAVYIGAEETRRDADTTKAIISGKFQIVFTSPEQVLQNLQWREMLRLPVYQKKLMALVVDEAHCVKDWGKQFRREFANIAEMRSLVPVHVKLMALTATASKSSRKKIMQTLCMEDVAITSVTPNKPNIVYHVKQWKEGIDEVMGEVVERVMLERTECKRTIIYCRTISDCIDVFKFFRRKLGKGLFEPMGAPNLSQFRIVDMYCSCTCTDVQKSILSSFTKPSAKLRIVIATIAFGLGLDCPDVRYVLHWGPPGNIEAYLQETGRAGRDGMHSDAILYYGPGQLRKDIVSPAMIDYCKNTTECRRNLLLSDFDGFENVELGSSCCDICVCEK